MGFLYPIMCDEVVPGDIFKIGNELVIRFQPLVAPMLHEVNAYIHYFFVPYRLLWDEWEEFITGGSDGQQEPAIPTWTPTNNAIGSLWDHIGLPVGVSPTGAFPLDFPRRAYNFIYNEYYRDENLITEVALTNEDILLRAWEKDYFTSALPFQQRGVAPSFPISGTTSAIWDAGSFNQVAGSGTGFPTNSGQSTLNVGTGGFQPANAKSFFDSNTVDLSNATTFDVSDLRTAVQIQRWLERNARAGVRYTEFLNAHFGVSPRDDRLDRPEFIGGTKSPCVISEVLQTGESGTTPQGNLAGHGMTVDKRFVCKKRIPEYGLIMGIMSIMPRTAYSQGIDRQWLRSSKYDFFFPEFAHLSEQGVESAEIFATAVSSENTTLFGYQGRYNEMRHKRSLVAGQMRPTGNLNYWTMAREFSGVQLLNQSFIECDARKDIFAVPSEDGLIVNIANVIKAIRPLPVIADPGYMDH